MEQTSCPLSLCHCSMLLKPFPSSWLDMRWSSLQHFSRTFAHLVGHLQHFQREREWLLLCGSWQTKWNDVQKMDKKHFLPTKQKKKARTSTSWDDDLLPLTYTCTINLFRCLPLMIHIFFFQAACPLCNSTSFGKVVDLVQISFYWTTSLLKCVCLFATSSGYTHSALRH